MIGHRVVYFFYCIWNFTTIQFIALLSFMFFWTTNNLLRIQFNKLRCRSNYFYSTGTVVLKVGGIDPLGAILRDKGAIEGKRIQTWRNCSTTNRSLSNFSNLELWHVSFLQILIYYDNRWRLLLKQFIRQIFYSGSSTCLATVLIIFTRNLNVILARNTMSQFSYSKDWFSYLIPSLK